ncbi:MAG: MotA/TolQ/ExbB proton channel family protein, partial [Myxococcota bacterium]
MALDAALQAFLKYVEMGGYVMPPLILATMTLWFALGFRVSVLRMGRGYEPRRLLAAVNSGKITKPRSAVERAAILGTRLKAQSTRNLRSRLDDVFAFVEKDLDKYRALTAAIVAVAPLLGLLGTVSGMIETFASLGDMTLYSQSGGIAGGISQALLTTQFGLTVAIPGLILRGVLDRRQKVLESQIEEIKSILTGDADRE